MKFHVRLSFWPAEGAKTRYSRSSLFQVLVCGDNCNCAMATRTSKRWYLELNHGGREGIYVIKGERELRDRLGKSVGPIKSLNQPSSRRTCTQAQSYLPYALEVECMNHSYQDIVQALHCCGICSQFSS